MQYYIITSSDGLYLNNELLKASVPKDQAIIQLSAAEKLKIVRGVDSVPRLEAEMQAYRLLYPDLTAPSRGRVYYPASTFDYCCRLPYIQGESVHSCLDPENMKSHFAGMLRAYQALYTEHSMLCPDFKPANTVLAPDGAYKPIDFESYVLKGHLFGSMDASGSFMTTNSDFTSHDSQKARKFNQLHRECGEDSPTTVAAISFFSSFVNEYNKLCDDHDWSTSEKLPALSAEFYRMLYSLNGQRIPIDEIFSYYSAFFESPEETQSTEVLLDLFLNRKIDSLIGRLEAISNRLPDAGNTQAKGYVDSAIRVIRLAKDDAVHVRIDAAWSGLTELFEKFRDDKGTTLHRNLIKYRRGGDACLSNLSVPLKVLMVCAIPVIVGLIALIVLFCLENLPTRTELSVARLCEDGGVASDFWSQPIRADIKLASMPGNGSGHPAQ